MDAVGSQSAFIFGVSEGAVMQAVARGLADQLSAE